MSRLDRITIQGFRGIRSVENLEIRPINVPIGANGSGKSNFVRVFDLLHEVYLGERVLLRRMRRVGCYVRRCCRDTWLSTLHRANLSRLDRITI